MKRLQYFAMLCVFVTIFAGVAWGDVTITVAAQSDAANATVDTSEKVITFAKKDSQELELTWHQHDDSESVQRFADGWWIGVKFTFTGLNEGDKVYKSVGKNSTPNEEITTWDVNDSSNKAIIDWVHVDETKCKNAFARDDDIKSFIQYTYKFKVGDNGETQAYKIKIDVKNITLKRIVMLFSKQKTAL